MLNPLRSKVEVILDHSKTPKIITKFKLDNDSPPRIKPNKIHKKPKVKIPKLKINLEEVYEEEFQETLRSDFPTLNFIKEELTPHKLNLKRYLKKINNLKKDNKELRERI